MATPIPPAPAASFVHTVHQSPPVDLSIPYSVSWLHGKTILITGGSTGFGAAFIRHWASAGATIIMGDINIAGGTKLAAEVNSSLPAKASNKVHFVHANVLDWDSMVVLFKKAVELSPHGGIDTVVANAGIAGLDPLLQPANLAAAEPKKPDFRIAEVCYIGVMYTVHLALFWLPRNPSSPRTVDIHGDPATRPRDRSILLLGSLASLGPLSPQPQYTSAKHAVLGLFRTLRGTCFADGIRINMLMPYFIDTPIVPVSGRLLLAGGATGKPEDVLDAGTRLVADSRINGRSLVVGPKLKIRETADGELELYPDNAPGVEPRAIWEAYADDFEAADLMSRRFMRVLSTVEQVRGWTGWAWDILSAAKYGVRLMIWGKPSR